MRNLIGLSRRRSGSGSGGLISNLLHKLHPSSSHLLHQTLKPSFLSNPNSIFHGPHFTSTSSSLSSSSLGLRFLSSQPGPGTGTETRNLKHQEIEGPTVDRDLSPLANETREVSLRLMKTMYDVSRIFAGVGLSQLALGAWISYPTFSPEITGMSVVGFALPFSMAFMIRQSLKHMHFFNKMEKIGRLQILTATMQISKHVSLFFDRIKVVGYLCLAGLPLPFVVSLLSSTSSSSS